MSETEHIKGSLLPFCHYREYHEAMALAVYECASRKEYLGFIRFFEGVSTIDYEGAAEEFKNLCYEEFYIYEDKVYKIVKEALNPYEDIFDAKKGVDGEIIFELKYYNGGCCMSEALEESLKKIPKADSPPCGKPLVRPIFPKGKLENSFDK